MLDDSQTDSNQLQFEVSAEIKRLDLEISGLLDAGRPGNKSIFFLIRRLLTQYHLASNFSESDILIEAYLRTRSAIVRGRKIENIQGWLRSVSFNIVREHARAAARRQKLLHRNTVEHLITSHPDLLNECNNSPSETASIELAKALDQLAPLDRAILDLRIVQGLSWEEVKGSLVKMQSAPDSLSLSALRQRGTRALKRLQRAFSVQVENASSESTTDLSVNGIRGSIQENNRQTKR